MNRDSVPAWKPTRERLISYPRTAFFKREKVRDELKRMLADAEAKGLPPSSVDSIYLQGDAAILEHEKRNGYDKKWGPNGVQRHMQDKEIYIPEVQRHILVE